MEERELVEGGEGPKSELKSGGQIVVEVISRGFVKFQRNWK